MSSRDYWDTVRETAKDAYDEWLEEAKADPHGRYIDSRASDILHEHIDSAAGHLDCDEVMKHTNNPDYLTRDIGDTPTGDWHTILSAFCHWAFYGDVNEEFFNTYDIQETLQELQEAADAEDEGEGEDDADDEPRRFTTREAFDEEEDTFDGLPRHRRLLDLFRRR